MDLEEQLQKLIQHYNDTLRTADDKARNTEGRAFGGVMRSIKGQLQEYLTENLVKAAWRQPGGAPASFEIHCKNTDSRNGMTVLLHAPPQTNC